MWLSRKGTIHAGAGARGLIPGSMGTASYVVVGKGNDMYKDIDAVMRDAADLVEITNTLR